MSKAVIAQCLNCRSALRFKAALENKPRPSDCFLGHRSGAIDPLLPFAFRQLMTALIAIAVFLKTREGETGCLILGSLRRRLIS